MRDEMSGSGSETLGRRKLNVPEVARDSPDTDLAHVRVSGDGSIGRGT